MDYSYDKCEQDLDCYLKNNDCIELPDKISCEIFETK